MSWPPIAKIGPDVVKNHTISGLVAHAKELADPYALLYVREIVEMAIRIKCDDARCSWLSLPDRNIMASFVALEPSQIMHELRVINREVDRLNLDTWTDATPFVTGHLPKQGGIDNDHPFLR